MDCDWEKRENDNKHYSAKEIAAVLGFSEPGDLRAVAGVGEGGGKRTGERADRQRVLTYYFICLEFNDLRG